MWGYSPAGFCVHLGKDVDNSAKTVDKAFELWTNLKKRSIYRVYGTTPHPHIWGCVWLTTEISKNYKKNRVNPDSPI